MGRWPSRVIEQSGLSGQHGAENGSATHRRPPFVAPTRSLARPSTQRLFSVVSVSRPGVAGLSRLLQPFLMFSPLGSKGRPEVNLAGGGREGVGLVVGAKGEATRGLLPYWVSGCVAAKTFRFCHRDEPIN